MAESAASLIPPRTRRRSRELALGYLYEAECKQIPLAEAVAGQPVEPPEFAVSLTEGVAAHLGEIDELIRQNLHHWKFERLPRVDLALLRLAVYELAFSEEVTAATAMDEAIELAKEYSTTDSSRYINGVLAGVLSGSNAAATTSSATASSPAPSTPNILTGQPGQLVLTDGTSFSGRLFGAAPDRGYASGEVVFNTSLVGYQEILTDPSYAGQIITFTYPHIGNYGVCPADDESTKPACRGIIVRSLNLRPSNWRATGKLHEQLAAQGLCAISDVDTRRLTRHIRQFGSVVGAFGTLTQAELQAAAHAEPGTGGVDLVAQVSCSEPYLADAKLGLAPPTEPRPWRIVAYDFGIKHTILRQLAAFAEVEVVPAATSASEVLARQPHGVFLSNGPGDPATNPAYSDNVAKLLGELPVFGICLGHQILAQALGAATMKLPFGHHGGNHPVANCATGKVEITAQNHNFAVADGQDSLPFEVTHRNLNDQTIEGLKSAEALAWGIQYHPEAGPGPHDSRYLFTEFAENLAQFHKSSGKSPN